MSRHFIHLLPIWNFFKFLWSTYSRVLPIVNTGLSCLCFIGVLFYVFWLWVLWQIHVLHSINYSHHAVHCPPGLGTFWPPPSILPSLHPYSSKHQSVSVFMSSVCLFVTLHIEGRLYDTCFSLSDLLYLA